MNKLNKKKLARQILSAPPEGFTSDDSGLLEDINGLREMALGVVAQLVHNHVDIDFVHQFGYAFDQFAPGRVKGASLTQCFSQLVDFVRESLRANQHRNSQVTIESVECTKHIFDILRSVHPLDVILEMSSHIDQGVRLHLGLAWNALKVGSSGSIRHFVFFS